MSDPLDETGYVDAHKVSGFRTRWNLAKKTRYYPRFCEKLFRLGQTGAETPQGRVPPLPTG